nr:stage 0 sporulation protein [Anaerolineae bacterium]
MAAPTAHHVVGVRFYEVGKLYHFDSSAYPDVELGDYVIVETARGRQLGQIMGFIPSHRVESVRVKPIMRPATARDLLMKKLHEAKAEEALEICRELALEHKELDGAKFVRASYNYDGSVLAFIYTSEEIVNTTRLRRQLARQFRSRVEMRRIGTRDAAKTLGEYGACGAPRCCASHLTEFGPISIKMAKAQGISLNPTEITGMCGRLRCCLGYEYEQYVEARKSLPRVKKLVGTPHGEGKVVDVNPLKGTVTVRVEDTFFEVGKDDLMSPDELRAVEARGGERGQGAASQRSSVPPDVPAADTGKEPLPRQKESKDQQYRSDGKRRPRRRRGRKSPDSSKQ